MNKYVEAALESYETIKTELKNFTRANTDFELDIDDGGYPLVFTFTPSETRRRRACSSRTKTALSALCALSAPAPERALTWG